MASDPEREIMKMNAILLGGILAAAMVSTRADDWPQWRGPNRDGISKESGLLKEWPAAGPKLVWQVKDVGAGYGAPTVYRDQIFLLSNSGVEDEFVSSYSVTDGKKLWTKRIGQVGNPNQKPPYPGCRSTPTVDGRNVFVLGSDGDLAALDLSGGVKWQKQVRKDFGGEPGVWAYSESPLIDGDALVVAPGQTSATLVKLKKDSGEVIWKAAVPDVGQAAYASTIVMDFGGVRQYVQLFQKALVGFDAKDGKELWRYDRAAKGSPANIPTPTAKNGIIYTAGAFTGGGAIKLKVDGGKVTVDELYFDNKNPNAIGGTILLGDTLYGTAAQGFTAMDFQSGKQLWQDKSIGVGSLLAADGRLYLHTEEGQVVLVEASKDGYHEKGKFTPANAPEHRKDEKTWAYPALANGQLYVRETSSLWRYDVKGK